RAGPAVGEQQRRGVLPCGPDVQEVDALPVDVGDELRSGVQPGLDGPPVESVQPVGGQVADPGGGHAVAAGRAGQLVRPLRPAQPAGQVVQGSLGDVHAVGADGGVAHGSSFQNGMICSVQSLTERNDPFQCYDAFHAG